MMSQLYCGAAKADISPKEEWFPFGRAPVQPGPFGGIIHPIYARVIAHMDGVLVWSEREGRQSDGPFQCPGLCGYGEKPGGYAF